MSICGLCTFAVGTVSSIVGAAILWTRLAGHSDDDAFCFAPINRSISLTVMRWIHTVIALILVVWIVSLLTTCCRSCNRSMALLGLTVAIALGLFAAAGIPGIVAYAVEQPLTAITTQICWQTSVGAASWAILTVISISATSLMHCLCPDRTELCRREATYKHQPLIEMNDSAL